jgi:hypothetical protein
MMLLGAALLAAAQAGAGTATPDYSSASNWLCLPGRADTCSTPLKTTTLNPNGYGSTGLSPVAKGAGIDCFYVYPTVSRDQGVNSDLTPGEEKAAVEVQFARFAGACRTFAPLYRSMTVGLIAAVAAGADYKAPFATASEFRSASTSTLSESWSRSSAAQPACSARPRRPRASMKSPAAAGAPRASPAGSFAVSATSPMPLAPTRSMQRSPTARSTGSRSTISVSTRWTGAI